MKKSMVLLLILFLLQTMLTGCWNRRELKTLAIVQAIGIDRTEDGQISLTVELLKPAELKTTKGGGGGGGGKGTWTLTSQGETVFDAFRNATLQSSRKLFISHDKIVVIGQEAAKTGIAPLLNFLDRDHEPRLLAHLFIAKGTAKDIIEADHEQEKALATALENLAKATAATSKIPRIQTLDVMKALISKTSDPFIPGVEIFQNKENEKVSKTIILSNTAIFKKDKLVGWFDKKETRGLLWILGEVKSGIIIVKSPQEEIKNVSLEIIKASSKIKPERIDGNLVITIEITEMGNLGEQMSEGVDLTKPDTFEELEKRQAAVIQSEINAALTKAQTWDADIFKFGEAVHRKFPGEWPELKETWDREFKNIEVKVEVEAKLRSNGVTTGPTTTQQ